MQVETVKLSDAQKRTLKDIVDSGKTPADPFNTRTVMALEGKGLVKLTEQKKGKFVAATAAGKKIPN